MKRYILTSPFVDNGGVAHFVKNIIPFLDNNVMLFRRGKRHERKSIIRYVLPIIDILRFVFFVVLIRPSKVVVNSSLSTLGMFRDGWFIRIARLFNANVILYIHGFVKESVKNENNLRGYFNANKIFVLSNRFKSFFTERGYREDNIEVVYNPVNQHILNSKIDVKDQNKDTMQLLFIGRIEKDKGIFTCLELMKFLPQSVTLKVIGEGAELSNAKQYVKDNSLNNVKFLGYLDGQEKINNISCSDVFVFPTTHAEGLPITVMECLTLGVYVLCTSVGGLIDLKESFEFEFIAPDNPEDIAKKIKLLMTDGVSKEIINNNRKKAAVLFSPKRFVEKIFE